MAPAALPFLQIVFNEIPGRIKDESKSLAVFPTWLFAGRLVIFHPKIDHKDP